MEKESEKLKMGLDAQESFAQMHKDRNMNKGIGGQMMQLDLVVAHVDAKINTLESKGKCSPSHRKSTKHASQFDLKLIRKKTKSNSRAYRLGFRISLRWAYRQALPILNATKRY